MFLKSLRYVYVALMMCAAVQQNVLAMLGGQTASIFEYPWLVSVRLKDDSGSPVHQCGGSIINSEYVLTAASCLATDKGDNQNGSIPAANVTILAGATQDTTYGAEIVYQVKAVKVNWQFNKHESKYNYDIGLIQIVGTFEWERSAISRVKIPKQEEDLKGLDWCKVPGWATFSVYSLHDVDAKRVSDGECASAYTERSSSSSSTAAEKKEEEEEWRAFLEDKVCAGFKAEARGPCDQDIGSPLVCRTEEWGYPMQVGIVSFIMTSPSGPALPHCPYKAPTYEAYTDVYHYRKWICLETGELCDPDLWALYSWLLPPFIIFGCCFCGCLMMSFFSRKPVRNPDDKLKNNIEMGHTKTKRPKKQTTASRATKEWVGSLHSDRKENCNVSKL